MNQAILNIAKDAIRASCTDAKLNTLDLGEFQSDTIAILAIVNGACDAISNDKSSGLLFSMVMLIASMKNPKLIGHMLEVLALRMPEFNTVAVQIADVLIEVGEEHATS